MTTLFEWSDEFSVGVSDIDEQHKELVSLLNQLNIAVHEHRGSTAVRRVLDELAAYTRHHFELEEAMMRESGYPHYDEHRRNHAELIDKIHELQRKLDSGEVSITFELLHFLRVWLMRHIGDADKRFGAYYQSPEAKVAAPPPVAEPAKLRWWEFWKVFGAR